MLQDRYGNSLTTSSTAARDAYVTGVDRLLGGDAKIEDAFRTAIAADDGFALAHIALARTLQLLGRVTWALPKWLDRRLPHLAVDPSGEEPAPPHERHAPEGRPAFQEG